MTRAADESDAISIPSILVAVLVGATLRAWWITGYMAGVADNALPISATTPLEKGSISPSEHPDRLRLAPPRPLCSFVPAIYNGDGQRLPAKIDSHEH